MSNKNHNCACCEEICDCPKDRADCDYCSLCVESLENETAYNDYLLAESLDYMTPEELDNHEF